MVEASKEAVHLVNLLRELDLEVRQPVNVFVDNQACIVLSKNSMNHGTTKHLAFEVHFVRNLVERRLLELNYLLPIACRQTHSQKHWAGPNYHFRDVLLGTNI